jgi:hypothetical protein
MKNVELQLVEIFGIGATRGMLGAGIALLLGEHLNRRERKSLGMLLAAVGLITTFPSAYDLLIRRQKLTRSLDERNGVETAH